MTQTIKLTAKSRIAKNGKAKKMIADSLIPAVIYGPGIKSRTLKVKRHDFERVFELAGEANLIDLIIDDEKPVKVIVKDIQRDTIKNNLIHIDFYQVDMSKKITAEIPLNFVGESRAVRELGGVLVKNINSIEVKCLPGNLVDHIDVDLSSLNSLGDCLRVEDIKLPNGMQPTSETGEMVASVIEPKKEEEEEAKEAAEEVTDEGGVEEGKADEGKEDKQKETESKADREEKAEK